MPAPTRDADAASAAVFHREGRTVVKHVLYGVGLTAMVVVLFRYRALVASDLAPSLATVPGISVALAETLLAWTMVALLVVGLPLFVATTVYMLYRRANPVPALVVDADGFTDEASLTNLGRVAWADVTRVELVEQMGVPQLRVTFEDPDRVLGDRGLIGAYLQLNRRLTSGDGAIPLHQLEAPVDEVVAAVEEYSGLTVDR